MMNRAGAAPPGVAQRAAGLPKRTDGQALRQALTEGLVDGARGTSIEIMARTANPRASTSSSEIVRCRLTGPAEGVPSVRELSVLVKCGAHHTDPHTGHTRGVPYEVDAYRRLLPGLSVDSPELLGSFQPPDPDATAWLFVEYAADSVRVNEARSDEALQQAAGALGTMHRDASVSALPGRSAWLNRYDGAYLRRWARRWARCASQVAEGRPWLNRVTKRLDEVLGLLDGPDLTVIHGEAYVANVLIRAGRALIVDWESVGVGVGELDLAALLLRWPGDSHSAESAYLRSRWPDRAPEDFHRRLDAARLHALGLLLPPRLQGRPNPKRLEILLTDTKDVCHRLGLL